MGQVMDRFCNYCTRFKADLGFKFLRHTSGTPRHMCEQCQGKRRLSKDEIVALTEKEKLERKAK